MDDFAQKMIYWNVAIYIASIVFFFDFKIHEFVYPQWLCLTSNLAVLVYYPWTLLTYSFFHSGFLHLLFNLMILHFSGRLFLSYFTQKQFLGLYLLSAIFAGLAFVGLYQIFGQHSKIIGASGAIMAILMATATHQPHLQLRLALIGIVKLWQFTAVILALDLIYIFAENAGGHIAHLAGALSGYTYVKLLQNGTDLTTGVSFIFDKLVNLFGRSKTKPFKKVHRNYSQKPVKKVSQIVPKSKTQQQIDEILDKISRSGYDSLSIEEKEFLFRAGK